MLIRKRFGKKQKIRLLESELVEKFRTASNTMALQLNKSDSQLKVTISAKQSHTSKSVLNKQCLPYHKLTH